jgi:hypothetical protein
MEANMQSDCNTQSARSVTAPSSPSSPSTAFYDTSRCLRSLSAPQLHSVSTDVQMANTNETPAVPNADDTENKAKGALYQLAMAHLRPWLPLYLNPEITNQGLALEATTIYRDDECVITSVKRRGKDKQASLRSRKKHITTPRPQLQEESLPSFQRLCNIRRLNEQRAVGTTQTELPVINEERIALGRMQSELRTMQSVLCSLGAPVVPPETIESIRHHRDTILYPQILRQSIAASINTPLQASVARELQVLLESRLPEVDRNLHTIQKLCKARGREYSVIMYNQEGEQAQQFNIYGNHLQAIRTIYKPADMMRAVYYWAAHRAHKSYGDIAFELSLPHGVLLGWILHFL